jgi:hypothetical protein
MGLLGALDAGADTVLLRDAQDNVVEGPGFNVFALVKGRLVTPLEGVLLGITRLTAIEIGRSLGYAVEERALPIDELVGAEEVFITSSGGGLMPVTRVNGRAIGDGTPGRVTQQMANEYWAWHRLPAYSTPVAWCAGVASVVIVTQPFLQQHAVDLAAVHARLERPLVVAELVVEAARGHVLAPRLDADAHRACGLCHFLQPGDDGAGDAGTAPVRLHREQQQVRVVVQVAHDAEARHAALLAHDHHIGVRVRDGPRHAALGPSPGQAVFDEAPRHRRDLRRVGVGGELHGDVGDHGPPSA